MPSPFPGMDPYLEGSEWTSFHAELGIEIVRQLVPKLAPKYIIRPIRCFVMDMPDEIAIVSTRCDTYPDVGVYRAKEAAATYETASATLTMPPLPLQMVTIVPEKVPVLSLEIRDTAERGLVTAIEILSPANKRGDGYGEYMDKRRRILSSVTHLLEIDLLRKGKRVPMAQPLPDAPYFVFLSRAEKRPVVDVWPIQLDMRLPVVPIPLLEEDEDVPLDLQLIFDAVYETYRYDLALDYSRPLDVPLEGKWATWAAERLEAAGFSTGGESV